MVMSRRSWTSIYGNKKLLYIVFVCRFYIVLYILCVRRVNMTMFVNIVLILVFVSLILGASTRCNRFQNVKGSTPKFNFDVRL